MPGVSLDALLAVREAHRDEVRRGALMQRLEAALNDDMNTAVALSEARFHIAAGARKSSLTRSMCLALTPDESWLQERRRELPADFLQRLHNESGAQFNGESPEAAITNVIDLRSEARASKNWAESDRLRDVLARCGVALKDSKDGTTRASRKALLAAPAINLISTM